jgi:hypothetical protein
VSAVDRSGHDLGREAFGTACGLSVVVGGLGTVAPGFDALVATLVVLALAAWASVHRRAYGGLAAIARAPAAFGGAFAALALAAAASAAAPAPLAAWRGLVLGLGLVPLWVVERRRRSVPPRGPGAS